MGALLADDPEWYTIIEWRKEYEEKIAKQLLSLFLSFGMLCGVVGTEGLPISAENNYDISLTITYPRVREVPEAPQDFDSNDSLDLTYLGCEWKNVEDTEQWDDGTEFIEWMYTFVNSRDFNTLYDFEDGKMYYQRIYFMIKNVSVSIDDEATATLVDSATMQKLNADTVYLTSCKDLMDELGGSVDLPSGMTINDSLMYIDTGSLICSPSGHMHTESSSCSFDDYSH